MKNCSKCKEKKNYSCFYTDARATDKKQSQCKTCISEYRKLHQKEAYSRRLLKTKAYHEKWKLDKEKLEAKHKQGAIYRRKNADKIKLYRMSRREERNKVERKKYHTDIQRRLAVFFRSKTSDFIYGKLKSGDFLKYVGCTSLELRSYIQLKFKPGMNWDNWSRKGWHLDHIKPLNSFDLTNLEDLKVAFHYTNVQPLWWSENLIKSTKISCELQL